MDEPTNEDGEKVTMRFGINVPDELADAHVNTKALGEINDAGRLNLALCVYVFDNSGFFVERAMATNLRHETGDLLFEDARRNQTTFTVELTKSKTPRKIHLVAVNLGDVTGSTLGEKYDKVVKKSHGYEYGSEATVMSDLYVDNNVDAYWGKVVVDEINEDTDTEDIVRVPLLRNFAKITVKQDQSLGSSTFKLEGFCVFYTPDRGSVAPYSTSAGGFVNYLNTRTETVGGNTITIEEAKGYTEISNLGYSGYMPSNLGWNNTTEGASNSGDGGYTFIAKPNSGDAPPAYLYECSNAIGDTKGKTFVIIKGKYNNSETSTYYKVDIIYKTEYEDGVGIASFYNILRNFNYQVVVKGVSFEGYNSAKIAAEMPATNNISASVQAEGANNVSDGSGRRLFVNTVYALYTSGGNKNGTLKCRFKDNDTYYPEKLKLRVLEGSDIFSDQPTKGGGGAAADDYYININFSLNNPEVIPKKAVLRVYVQENENVEALYRDIEILLRYPYDLKVDCTDVVQKTAGTAMKVNLLIQDGMNKNLFPLDFPMEAEKKTIYPNTSSSIQLPVNVGTSIVPGSSASSFQYVRTVTWAQYSGAATVTKNGITYRVLECDYKTNTADSKTKVYAKNDYCCGKDGEDPGYPAFDEFKNGNPLFLDGDAGVATILPSDYYGAGNSFHYITFKTVRRNAVVAISFRETEGSTPYEVALNVNLNNLQNTATNQVVNGATVTTATVGGATQYTFKIPFYARSFKGDDYYVNVDYNTTNNAGADFEDNIEGAATLSRRYLFIPLLATGGAFETNIGSNNYNNEEYMKTGIGDLYKTDGGDIKLTTSFNTGRVYFKQHGAATSVDYYDNVVGYYNRDEARTDGGWQFPDGTIYNATTERGYHIDLTRHSSLNLTPDMYWCIHSPQSTANKSWCAKVRIGDITDAHARDFQEDVAAYVGNRARNHPNDGLDKMAVTFAALP